MAVTEVASLRSPASATHGDIGRQSRSLWGTAILRLQHDHTTLIAIVILVVMIVLAAAADFLADNFFHYGFTKQDLLNGYTKPTLTNPAMWLGSDNLGRSQIVRLLYGGRVSLSVGLGAAVINLTLGLVLGLVSGYARGWIDDVVQFVISTLLAIPSIPLLLIVAVLFQPGPAALVIILGLLRWPNATLFVRGQTLSLREREFITAGEVAGATHTRLIFNHILPNVLPLVIVLTAIDVGSIILVESVLSYLGLGISPPTPSWGNMLTTATQDLSRGPWLVYAPGTAIFLTVLCLYLVGDGLRDALDPRLTRTV